jgi:hypothetical protein
MVYCINLQNYKVDVPRVGRIQHCQNLGFFRIFWNIKMLFLFFYEKNELFIAQATFAVSVRAPYKYKIWPNIAQTYYIVVYWRWAVMSAFKVKGILQSGHMLTIPFLSYQAWPMLNCSPNLSRICWKGVHRNRRIGRAMKETKWILGP